MDELNQIIANNLIHFRKTAGLTQSELAEKLCYSDKSVSKWERGDSIPDIIVLKKIADLYNITLDTLVSPNAKKQKSLRAILPFLRQKHVLISIMSIGLVWLLATVAFVCLGMIFPSSTSLWKIFIIALPISFIVAVVFSFIWGKGLSRAISVSGLVWSLALMFYLLIDIMKRWLIFIIPVPVTILITIWYIFRHKIASKKKQL